MKIKFAVEKSEYSYNMWKCIEVSTSDQVRKRCYARLKEIESYLKSQGDNIQVIVTTKNTSGLTIGVDAAKPMTI